MVTVEGSSLTFWSGETYFSHEFDVPLRGGPVALGSKGGAPRFDNIKLEWLGGGQDLEFLELAGAAGTPVDLGGWLLDGIVDVTLPAGTQLDAGVSLVVVGFDPAAPGREAFFREAHGIEPSVPIVGPYRGDLDDTGGVVRLHKPGTLPAGTPGFVVVDQVQYARQAPWPAAAAALGRGLSRAAVTAPGHVATSWSALPPTPGVTHFAVAGDLNFDGHVNVADVGYFAEVVAEPAAYRAAYGLPATLTADLDQDGDIDFDDIDDFVTRVGGGTAETATRLRSSVPRPPVVPAAELSSARFESTAAAKTLRARRARHAPPEHGAKPLRREPTSPATSVSQRERRRLRHGSQPGTGRDAATRASWESLTDRALIGESTWRAHLPFGREA
jgi:hypothetical protein